MTTRLVELVFETLTSNGPAVGAKEKSSLKPFEETDFYVNLLVSQDRTGYVIMGHQRCRYEK